MEILLFVLVAAAFATGYLAATALAKWKGMGTGHTIGVAGGALAVPSLLMKRRSEGFQSPAGSGAQAAVATCAWALNVAAIAWIAWTIYAQPSL